MTGRIISLHGDLHDEVSGLLPWYVTGRLDDDDRARVELHLKTYAQCQTDLAAERALHAEIANLPETGVRSVDGGWAALRAHIGPVASSRSRVERVGRQWQSSAPWLRWAVAAQ